MSQYLDAAQRDQVKALLTGFTARTEWPTWLLIVVIHGGWLALALNFTALGPWLGLPLLAVACAWHTSLQHELLHGHPTRVTWVNTLLASAPLALWYPFAVYRRSHLQHHSDDDLTLPGRDPESYYVDPKTWRRYPAPVRGLLWFNKTVAGRLLVGPALAVGATWAGELRRIRGGDHGAAAVWLLHGILVGALLWWLDRVCGISPLQYVFGVAYPALSLALLRAYYEHRPWPGHKERCVLNEAALPWRVLYLNNTYHLVHHDLPGIPWFLLPAVYRARRREYLQRSGGFLVPGFLHLVRRHLFRPVDSPVHPFG